MLDEKTIRFISELFNGDLEKDSGFIYKSGPDIYRFFNTYFGYKDKYNWGGINPSRWQMTFNKLIEFFNKNLIDKFFNIILSIKYLYTEFPTLNKDQLAEKSDYILEIINNKLLINGYKILKASNRYLFMEINDDLELLGGGGFANIYLIKSKNIVLRKLKDDLVFDKSIVSRFKREYEITNSLSNISGIIRVFEYNPKDVSYTMERAEIDLETYINNNILTFDNCVKIIRQIIQVLEKVHSVGVIHRDLCPRNILLFSGELKIADFGLGKDLTIFHSHQTINTNSMGQFHYCDPRQFMKLKEGDVYSDIYSLGKVINFIFTKDPNNSMHKFKMIAEKATAPSELSRYHNLTELSKDVEHILSWISDSTYNEEILKKINEKNIDQVVFNYMSCLTINEVIKNLENSNFLDSYKNYLFLLHNKNDIYVVIELAFNELKVNKKYTLSSIDNLGILCIYILQELSIPLYVKEHSADLIRYIISEFNSDVISSILKSIIDSGIDPLLEEKLAIIEFPE